MNFRPQRPCLWARIKWVMGAAVDGPEAAIKELGLIIEEARIGLALSDCCNVNEFAMRKPVLSGLVALWADRNDIPNKGGAN